jgi:hypothetical protein
MNEIDKILTQARNHYQTTADTEGRGRFPGQEKYNSAVGDYTTQNALTTDIDGTADAIMTFSDSRLGSWRSVFGISNVSAPRPTGCFVKDDTNVGDPDNGTSKNADYGTLGTKYLGHNEWLALFAENTLASKYQDGHFAYAVIAGSLTGSASEPPVLYVIDVENASNFNNVIEP